MASKERNRERYYFRKENGLCTRCGKELDRGGMYCASCNDRHNAYSRANRKFWRENNICTICGKEPVPGTDRICPECRIKHNAARKPLTEEQILVRNKRYRTKQNELYKQRKEHGICTRCGKRKAEAGRAKCGLCLAKDVEVQRQRRWKEKEAM